MGEEQRLRELTGKYREKSISEDELRELYELASSRPGRRRRPGQDAARGELHRHRQAQYQRARSKAARDIEIPEPSPEALKRRKYYRSRPGPFLRYYFPQYFTRPHTPDQKARIRIIADRMMGRGENQAIAAARTDGKTTEAKGMMIWGLFFGWIRYAVTVSRTNDEKDLLYADFQKWIETSERLREDFPEIVLPVLELGRQSNRAKGQTYQGRPTYIEWSSKKCVFADIPGSAAAGSVFTARSMETAIVGLVEGDLRPDFVLIDDIETVKSVTSEADTIMRERRLREEILGLGGTERKVAIVMLVTIYAKGSLADRYTDLQLEPAWQGIRQPFVISWPKAHETLWQEYLKRRQQDQLDGDPDGRTAYRFFVEHEDEMLEGWECNNQYRGDKRKAADGTIKEPHPALYLYNYLAAGEDTFVHCQLQLDPQDDDEEIRLEPAMVQRKLSHLERGMVPAWVEALTMMTDVGARSLHWAIWACRRGGSAWCVDYGKEDVDQEAGSVLDEHRRMKPHAELAVRLALENLRDRMWEQAGWPMENGGTWELEIALVDARYLTNMICDFVRSDGSFLWRAAMGCGEGRNQPRFNKPERRPRGTRVHRPVGERGFQGSRWEGDGWFASYDRNRQTNIYYYSDEWKQRAQRGFLASPDSLGSLALWGDKAVEHRVFGHHICAERWQMEHSEKAGAHRAWKQTSPENHQLDVTAGALVAADIAGVQMAVGRQEMVAQG